MKNKLGIAISLIAIVAVMTAAMYQQAVMAKKSASRMDLVRVRGKMVQPVHLMQPSSMYVARIIRMDLLKDASLPEIVRMIVNQQKIHRYTTTATKSLSQNYSPIDNYTAT